MESKLQHHIAFYLTGSRERSNLLPMNERFRPALLARFGDLTSLRYDFPLVLNQHGTPERALLSLSQMVDEAVAGLDEFFDRNRIARHGYRLESLLRQALAANGVGDFETVWNAAVNRLIDEGGEAVRDSAKRLWSAFQAHGQIVDADSALPARVIRHAWSAVQASKTEAFRRKTERLLHKLRSILEAEAVGSAVGRSPDRLKASVGSSFAGAFNFEAMSNILGKAKPATALSDERRTRIRKIINVLENQRFYPLKTNGTEPYAFSFSRCSDALKAFQDRHEEAVELVKTLAVADLEARGDYRESVHNLLFENFGANGLDAGELAQLPDYLVCTDVQTLDAAETAQLVELLAAGLPIKILVQTDDVLQPSVVAEGHVALGLRARQLVHTAIGLTDVFVFQSSASHIPKKRDSLMRGLSFNGPALFSVFSGANGHTGEIPAYLVAAAAMESRVFPALVYDPSAGSDWAARLNISDNPLPEDDWATHEFNFEDEKLQSQKEKLAFSLADFMAMDDRFFTHYAIVPKGDWHEAMISVTEALQTESKGLPEKVPSILLVDDNFHLQRAIFDDRTLAEVRRCQTMWHSLQELGGIHNSHAERLFAQERKAKTVLPLQPEEKTIATPTISEPPILPTESPAAESHSDEPYIESARCTSCNECIHVNGKMFAYNENKQAYIADLNAGTFRQLVEAAEGCQVSIIHPGKPRNPKEPGLDDLIKRASQFN